MSKELKTIYEPHPVSPARKKELRAQGYRIVDAAFAPRDARPAPASVQQPNPLPPPPAPAPAEKPKLGLPKKD
jgi:hypothetical protein